MSNVPDDLLRSVERRRVPLRRRPDVDAAPFSSWGRRCWNLKDPVSLAYFQLGELEHFVWQQLDGATSYADIQEACAERFHGQRVAVLQLQSFVAALYREGLLINDQSGGTPQLLEQRATRRRRRRLSMATNLLAIRFPGVNPTRLLDWLYPRFRWIFSKAALAASVLLVLAAVVLLWSGRHELPQRLPDWQSFLQPRNLLGIALAIAGTKVLHELGHALTCRHLGGRCHEFGFMLLVFTPCLYVNVSDAWTMSSKWRRIGISVAGIWVELVLAALATFAWWYSVPGALHWLMLDVLIVCSVGTLVFNGNPLLRFDGYFVLSEILDAPNLWENSRAVLKRRLGRWCLGIELPGLAIDDRRQWWLTGYALLSNAYLWFVVAGVLGFLHAFLKPRGLELLVVALACLVLAGLLWEPLRRFARLLSSPVWREKMKWKRLGATAAVVTVAVILIGWLPLPCRVAAPCVLEPGDRGSVYVTAPGRIVNAVAEGTRVEAGEPLAQLSNETLELELVRLQGELASQRQYVDALERIQSRDTSAADELPAARAALVDLEDRVRLRNEDLQRLTINSPAQGVVVPAVWRGLDESPTELPQWWGHPLQPQNRGSFLASGTLLCRVADPARMEATLTLSQEDVALVRPGQRVTLRLRQAFRGTLSGTVMEIAEVDQSVSAEIAEHASASPSGPAALRPSQPATYRARVELDRYDQQLLVGAAGTARVAVAPTSIGARLLRYLRSTFSR